MAFQDRYCPVPLPKNRDIRLLRILPRILPRIQEHVSVELKIFSLEDLPQYEALSYTWGKATRTLPEESKLAEDDNDDNLSGTTHEIFINSLLSTVTENLYDGLVELEKDVNGYLWVDALCINQGDMQERASQVKLMGDIYSSAECVIVWLGKSTPEVEQVIWLVERLAPIIGDSRFRRQEADTALFASLGISTAEWFQKWTAYSRFYQQYRWFSRAWVFQEYLMAPKITMRCGNQTLESDKLAQLSTYASTTGLLRSPSSARFVNFGVVRGTSSLGPSKDFVDETSLMTGSKTDEERWYSLLSGLSKVVREQRAGCPHDMVYAIFGIAQKAMPPSLHNSNNLIVDYERSKEDAFVAFAKLLLENLPSLTLLSLSEVRRQLNGVQSSDLPSWCPDYAALQKTFTLTTLNMVPGLRRLAASGHLKREGRPCYISGKTLTATGRRVGLVQQGYQVATALEPNRISDPEGLKGWFDACLQLDLAYTLTGQDRLEVLWRTIVLDVDWLPGHKEGRYPEANKFSSGFVAYITWQAAFALFFAIEKNETETYSRILSLLEAREKNFRASTITLPTTQTIVKVSQLMRKHKTTAAPDLCPTLQSLGDTSNGFLTPAKAFSSGGRRLFTTSQKWLGYGPEFLKPGDEVWLLKQADVPFILRRQGNSQYKIIGEAYVHGIMHGELVKSRDGQEGFRDIHIV